MKIEELKAQIEIEKIRAQVGVKTVGGATEGTTGIYANQVRPKLPKLPAFVDGKDDLDSWLLRFERFAITNGWPKENWCTSLSALPTGRALEVCCRLTESEAVDYDRVKEVLQKRYNLTEDGYRQKFRVCTPEDGENPNMFIVRLKTYLERWMKLSETQQPYDGLGDLFIREQFLDVSPVDLSTYLRQRKLPTLDEVAQSAYLFLTACKRRLSDSVKPVTFNSQSKTFVAKKPEVLTCYICKKQGHRAVECRSNNVMKQNLGRGCFCCGEMTHVKKDSLRLKREGSKVSSPKRAGSAAVWVVETHDAAPGGSAGVTDTGCDVRAEVQDGLLQLVSGKRAPAIVDCGACGGKKSVEDINLSVVKGLDEDKTLDVLRDTGCTGVVVSYTLIEDSQFMGKRCLIVRIDNTVLLAEKARIRVKTPSLSGDVEALYIPEAICDLVVGNVPGARNPDDSDVTVIVSEVTTRSQARQKAVRKPLRVSDAAKHTGVDRAELIRLQQEDYTIKKIGEAMTSTVRAGKTSSFEKKNGIVYRVYHDMTRGGATTRQVVLPESLRKYVMSIAHDTITGGHLGIRRTREKIMSNFYWPGIYGDVGLCQNTVSKGTVPKVPLQSVSVVDVPFKCVAVDLIRPIDTPSEIGHRYILTLVDYATRYPEAIPQKRIHAKTVAEA